MTTLDIRSLTSVRVSRRSLLKLAGVAVSMTAIVPLLAACGDDDDDDGGSGAVATSTTSAASGTTATGAVTTAATSAASTSGTALMVSLKEWSVTPSVTTIAAGSIEIEAMNDGTMEHELVVLMTDTAAAGLTVGSDGGIDEATAGEMIGEIEGLAAGASEKKTFDLEAGHYVLLCNLPGHYAQGMRADLTVT